MVIMCVSFQASMHAATNVNRQLQYFEPFVSNTYALILCVTSQHYSFLNFLFTPKHNQEKNLLYI